MRITLYGVGCEGGPGDAEIGGLVNVSVHVTGLVSIEGDVGRAGLMVAGFDAAHQCVERNARNIADEILPSFPAVAGELQIAVIGSNPDDFRIARRLADGVDGAVILCARIVDGDAAGLLLLLLLWIVGGEIGRDSFPGFAAVARAEQKLAADIDGVRL